MSVSKGEEIGNIERCLKELEKENYMSTEEEKALENDVDLIGGFYRLSGSYSDSLGQIILSDDNLSDNVKPMSDRLESSIKALAQLEKDKRSSDNKDKKDFLIRVINSLLEDYMWPGSVKIIESEKKALESPGSGVFGWLANSEPKLLEWYLDFLRKYGYEQQSRELSEYLKGHL